MSLIFEGLRVVDLTSGMAGPMASMILADNGAEVIKIEKPEGDWARGCPGFLMWNRGKKSIVLDLTSEQDKQRVDGLIKSADVVMTAFGAGQAARFGLEYERFQSDCPSLIWCEISGFGLRGKYETLQGYESIVMAKTGRFLGNDTVSGAADFSRVTTPLYLAAPTASYGAAILALQGISAALYARNKTACGQLVETSLLQGVSAATMRLRFQREGETLVPTENAGELELVRKGIALTFLVAECSDGRFIQMCARQDNHFKNWMSALGLADLLNESRFARAPLGFSSIDDIAELESLVRKRMSEKTQAEWMDLFATVFDVGADPFLTPREFLEFPDMVLNGRVVEIHDPVYGPVKQLGPLVHFATTPSKIERSAPGIGEHQSELAELQARSVGARPFCGPPSGASESDVTKPPLDGVTIVELAYFLAGPFSTTLLAELGARVIKVEPLAGDPYRHAGIETVHLLAGKESITLDIKSTSGYKVLCDLVRNADMFMTNFRHGVPQRLCVDYDTLRTVNPHLVYVYAGSYGSNGPWALRAAFHSTPNALSGGGILQAGRGNPPVDDSYPDPCSGMAVGAALLLGLLARTRYGTGQYIETTMLTSGGYVHSNDLTFYEGVPARALPDGDQLGLNARHRLYRCSSGWIFISAVREADWVRLAKVLGHPEWLDHPKYADVVRTGRGDDELASACASIFAQDRSTQWERRLEGAGVPVAAVDDGTVEVFMHREGLLEPDEHQAFGEYWRLPPRLRFSRARSGVGRPCGAGEHTDALLAELGYRPDTRAELVASGVVGPFDGSKNAR